MRVEVTIADEALMQIAELPRLIRLRVLNVTQRLENWPQVSGVKWLTGDGKDKHGFERATIA